MLKLLVAVIMLVSIGYASELMVVEGGLQEEGRLLPMDEIQLVFEAVDYFVVIAPDNLIDESSDMTVLDSGDILPEDYLLVHLSSPAGLEYMDELGETVFYREDIVIVKLIGPAPEKFIREGVFFLQPLRVKSAGDGSDVPFLLEPPAGTDDYISDIVAAVSEDSIKAFIQHLEDYGTRYSSTDNFDTACNWVQDKFENYGLDAEQQTFNMGSYNCQNVIAELPGTVDSTKIFIICGHLDSTCGSAPSIAPGADDNASGSSSVVEAARILTGYEFEYTIRFICFGGEEQGLYGSSYYASEASSAGEDILGVVNLDMVLYAPPGDDIIWVPYDTQSNDLALALEAICDTYVPALTVEIEYSPGSTYSDHASFWNNGYAAVLGIEKEISSNPYYHQTTDLLANYIAYFPFPTNCIKGAIATVAYLAVPVGLTGITGEEISAGFAITGISPNPAHSTLTVDLLRGFAGNVEVSLFDLTGRRILSGSHDASSGSVALLLSNLPSGVYIVRVSSGSISETRNIVIVR
ncbi:MAG: M28 family peptidase [Candidatus Aegiribacteria sp.]|nr:M28 family peptidase [Candidatus Aegiribacteria sp.]